MITLTIKSISSIAARDTIYTRWGRDRINIKVADVLDWKAVTANLHAYTLSGEIISIDINYYEDPD